MFSGQLTTPERFSYHTGIRRTKCSTPDVSNTGRQCSHYYAESLSQDHADQRNYLTKHEIPCVTGSQCSVLRIIRWYMFEMRPIRRAAQRRTRSRRAIRARGKPARIEQLQWSNLLVINA